MPEDFGFVARTMKSGDWKNWFIEEDVEYFKPYLQPYILKYGYSDDWTLPDSPVLDPAYGSHYVLMLIEDFYSKFVRPGPAG